MSRTFRWVALAAVVALVATSVGVMVSRRPDTIGAGAGQLAGGAEVRPQTGMTDGPGQDAAPPPLSTGIAGGAPPLGRPARAPTHPDENPHPPPPAVVGEAYINAIVLDAPVLLADVALPWRYQISDQALLTADEAVIHEAVADWDGLPGSRWAAAFDGTTTVNKAVADGRSVIFAETSCTGITNANAYLFTDGGLGIGRYGASGTQILEADIGICPRIADAGQLRRAIRHEVGHVVGLAHQCAPGDECWRPEMGEADTGCRVMYWQARVCQDALGEGDVAAARALYPTLRPLVGPTSTDTAARVAFATVADGSAALAVVLDPASGAALAGPAAALAGRAGGPLLVAEPDQVSCLTGAAREELNRALRRRGTAVFVGTWPTACRRLGVDWDLDARLVSAENPVTGAIALADVDAAPGPTVLIANEAAAVPAAALAARLDGALLPAVGGVDPAAHAFIAGTGTDPAAGGSGEVWVAGGGADNEVVADLVNRGLTVRHFQGDDPVALSLVLAEAGPVATDPVVLGPANTAPEGFVAAALAGRLDAPLLLSPGAVDQRVADALARLGPTTGWAVDAHRTLPWNVVADYGTRVGTS